MPPKAEREELSQSYPIGLVPKAELEFMVSWFLALITMLSWLLLSIPYYLWMNVPAMMA